MAVKSHFDDDNQLITSQISYSQNTKPDEPNLLLLVAHFSLLLQDGEAGKILPYMMQRI